jgi:hypothetical protein
MIANVGTDDIGYLQRRISVTARTSAAASIGVAASIRVMASIVLALVSV